MAVENGPIGGQTENDDVRRRALLRLGVAAMVTAAALAGLWWLDQGGGKQEKPTPAALPSPIVTAPMQASAPPQTAPDEAATEGASEPATGVATNIAEAPPTKPPEQASRTTPMPPAAAPPTRTVATGEAPPPPRVNNVSPRALTAAAPPPRPAPSRHAATALGEPYLVQVGVFSEPERARELVERLNKRGIRAHMETRVQLGPFANREEAEKAQATIRALGLKGVLTPVAATQ